MAPAIDNNCLTPEYKLAANTVPGLQPNWQIPANLNFGHHDYARRLSSRLLMLLMLKVAAFTKSLSVPRQPPERFVFWR